MSDPVTNAEVEDVLSSIRRLVSEDKRPLQTPKTDAPADRLVLTPALRVADKPEVEEESTANAPDDVHALRPATGIESLVTHDRPLDVYGDRDMAEDDLFQEEAEEEAGLWADNGSETVDRAELAEDSFDEEDDTFLLKTLPDGPEVADAETQQVMRQAGQTEERDAAADAGQTSALAATEATEHAEEGHHAMEAGEAAQETPADTAAPDTAQPIAADQESAPSQPVRDSLSELLADQAEDAAAPADHDQTPEPQTPVSPPSAVTTAQVERSAALSSKIAALETAIGKIADTWEPDDPGESDYAGTEPDTLEWEDDEPEDAAPLTSPFLARPQARMSPDQPEHDALAQTEETEAAAEHRSQQAPHHVPSQPAAAAQTPPESPPVAEPDPVPPLDLRADEQLIDEEMLRDLVSEIVRAELQGALGERITRNVRKLVRREIHRALTAQDLE